MSKYFITTSLNHTSFLVYSDNKYEHRLNHSKAMKILIKSLTSHRNILLTVVVSTKMINLVISIFVRLIYSIDRGMHNRKHDAISNKKNLLKLLA